MSTPSHAPRLTKRLLDAIAEALEFRTAGELGDDAFPVRDYDDASRWVAYQMARRERTAPTPNEPEADEGLSS